MGKPCIRPMKRAMTVWWDVRNQREDWEEVGRIVTVNYYKEFEQSESRRMIESSWKEIVLAATKIIITIKYRIKE